MFSFHKKRATLFRYENFSNKYLTPHPRQFGSKSFGHYVKIDNQL